MSNQATALRHNDYDVRAIANWFLDRAEKSGTQLTAMKLQKLIYVAHGWHLAFYGTPLVHEAVEAWKWGPVFRSIYREFRDYGSRPIATRATAFDGASLEERQIKIDDYGEPGPTCQFLESVWNVYKDFNAGELSDITHQPGTPWYQIYEQMGNAIRPFTLIPNELIADHYKKLLDERASKNTTGRAAKGVG
jgi:uncharacterized phage-associated protein